MNEDNDGITLGPGFATQEPIAEVSEPEKVVDKSEEVQETAEEGAEPADTTETSENEETEEEKPEKPRKQPSDRIKQLTRERNEERRRNEELISRLENLENRLTPQNQGNNPDDTGNSRPDPNDLDRYPLGALDDRFIQDMIEHVADEKTAKALESVLQREQERAQQAEAEKQLTELRTKAETLVSRGSELHDDFDDLVYQGGLRGDYDLTQTTFEAAAEAEHGAEILYALAADKQEAHRVATLSPFQQIKYVMDKNAELAKAAKPAPRLPKADVPPQSGVKGSGTRLSVPLDTDDQDAFDKLFFAKR